jgi:hypothetical protein
LQEGVRGRFCRELRYMKYEYKVLLIQSDWSAAEGLQKMESQLNELGKDGWELVPITVEGYLFLKKAKKDE